jgi:hypothetical protein
MSSIIIAFCVILVILFIYTIGSIQSADLDKKILSDWWHGSPDFIKQAGLTYMFINFEPVESNKYNGYITAGDDEGMIYNNPIKISLNHTTSDSKYKGKYILNVIEGETPFPQESTLIVDRTNSSFSVYKDDILYGHLIK